MSNFSISLTTAIAVDRSVKVWKNEAINRQRKREMLRDRARRTGHDVESDPAFCDGVMRRRSLMAFGTLMSPIVNACWNQCVRDNGRVFKLEYTVLLSRMMEVLRPELTENQRQQVADEEWEGRYIITRNKDVGDQNEVQCNL
jgi:hypothetical protein